MKIEPIFPEKDITRLGELIDRARRVVITCHISPDGDALGSSLGLAAILRAMDKTVHVVTPDFPPLSFSFLPGYKDIVIASMQTEMARGLLANADLVFALDYNQLQRIDRLGPAFEAAKAPKVVIDHHLKVTLDAELIFSAPEKSSTSMLIYIVASQLGCAHLIDKVSATCLLTGMITDTGNFSYSSNDPQIFLIAAELVARGVDKDRITRKVLRTYTFDQMNLNLFALRERLTILPEVGAALIHLSSEDLASHNYRKGDTEGLVNVPLGLPGVVISLFIRQENPTDKVKVSARSLGHYPANKLCEEWFNGGGHQNAAGGEWRGTLDEACTRGLEALRNGAKWLPDDTNEV